MARLSSRETCGRWGCSELRDELPCQWWNEGLQPIICRGGPVIHARRGVRAIERAHFDGKAGHAAFEVVADVLLASDHRRRDVRRNRAAVVLRMREGAVLPAPLRSV